MSTALHPRKLKQALGSWHRALEEFESALPEFEEIPYEKGNAPKRNPGGQTKRLLSLPEVREELGEGRTAANQRPRSGEAPSLR